MDKEVSLSMVQSVIWLTLASLAMRAVSMYFQVYLSGQIGAAGLGLMQLIMTVHAFAITVGTSGIRVAAMYLPAEEYGHKRFSGIRTAMVWCIGTGLLLSSIVGTIMTLAAQPLAVQWVKDIRAAASLRLLGMTLPLTCLSSVLGGYFTACGKIKKLVIIEILDRIATVGSTIWLLRRGMKGDLSHACVSIVAGGALASLGSAAALFFFMLRDLRKYPKSDDLRPMGSRLLRFCVPVALNDYLRSGLGTLEQFLIPYGLAKCGGSRTKALADYGTIQGMVFPILMFLSTVLFSVADLLVPRLARCKAQKDTARLRSLTTRCWQTSYLFSAAVAGAVYVLALPLGQLFYHSADAGRYLKIFAPLLPVLYLDCIIDGMHKGLGEQIYCVRVNTLTNLLDVIGLFLLLPRFGIGGYFFTYVTTHVINFFLSFRRLSRVTGYLPDLRFLLTVILCVCTSAGFCALFLPAEPAWSTLFLNGGIYLVIAALLFVLTDKKHA